MNHPAAWVTWVAAVLIILSATRNPWYVLLTLACLLLVRVVIAGRETDAAPVPISLTSFGLVVVTFSALFNALTVHFGDWVLFSLPEIIPYFGGIITLEALLFGAINGLVLTGLFAAFTVFNQAVSTRGMIRLVPRAFFPVAVMIAIAITFVPVTLQQYRDIREAQAVRGHQLRGWRDWLPLMMPLLVGGLERALQLAEAMTARGFASSESPTLDTGTRLAVLLGLLLLTAGWLLRLVWGLATLGLLTLLLGLALIAGTLWLIGRRVPRTRYRPQRWTSHDTLIVGGAMVAAGLFVIPLPGLDYASIYFYPYPSLTWPGFELWLVVGLIGLLLPMIPPVPISLSAEAEPSPRREPEMEADPQ